MGKNEVRRNPKPPDLMLSYPMSPYQDSLKDLTSTIHASLAKAEIIL